MIKIVKADEYALLYTLDYSSKEYIYMYICIHDIVKRLQKGIALLQTRIRTKL